MVREEKGCYYCGECEMSFMDKKKACECEESCKKNKVCDITEMKHTINTREGTSLKK